MTLPVETNEALITAETHDQQYFLDLFDRILPSDYLEPLKDVGPGYEFYEALAALGERLSRAIVRFKLGNYIATAPGGQKAQANVLFSRPTATAGAVTIQGSTIVTTSQGDRRFILLEDVVFGGSDTGPLPGVVEAIDYGYEYNVRGERTAANGEVLPGEIDTIFRLYEDPPYGDPTIVVSQVEDAQGGQPDMLDELGIDRGLLRAVAETDEAYRIRISTLPDTVSPAAIKRAVSAILDPLGITYDFIETWEIEYQTCYDAPTASIPGSDFDPDLFCYDDPRPYRDMVLPTNHPVMFNVWLDVSEFRGAFIIVVPIIGAVLEYGLAYDDPAIDAEDLITPGILGGQRAVPAYDVPSTLISTEIAGAYDGDDIGAASIWKGLWDVMQQIKAAGVSALLEQYSTGATSTGPTITGINGNPDPYSLVALDHIANPPDGDTITINGSGFLTATQVDLLVTASSTALYNAKNISFTIIDDNNIEITALAIATAYLAAGGTWPADPLEFPIGPWKPRVWNPGGIATASDDLNVSLDE